MILRCKREGCIFDLHAIKPFRYAKKTAKKPAST